MVFPQQHFCRRPAGRHLTVQYHNHQVSPVHHPVDVMRRNDQRLAFLVQPVHNCRQIHIPGIIEPGGRLALPSIGCMAKTPGHGNRFFCPGQRKCTGSFRYRSSTDSTLPLRLLGFGQRTAGSSGQTARRQAPWAQTVHVLILKNHAAFCAPLRGRECHRLAWNSIARL